jgi:hypothetical protein
LEDVFIAGVGMTGSGVTRSARTFSWRKRPCAKALSNSGGRIEDLQAAFYATVVQGVMANQHVVPGAFAPRPLGVAAGSAELR